MGTSARNALREIVSEMTHGAVDTGVKLRWMKEFSLVFRPGRAEEAPVALRRGVSACPRRVSLKAHDTR
jgi:hypothetical protein